MVANFTVVQVSMLGSRTEYRRAANDASHKSRHEWSLFIIHRCVCALQQYNRTIILDNTVHNNISSR